MNKAVWEKQDKGWYTSPMGGVARERNGWYFYPIDESAAQGPFKTMALAIVAAAPTQVGAA